MDVYQIVSELKFMLKDYGVVFPHDPYGALDLEEVIAEFLDKYFTVVADEAYDDGVADGHESGYSSGYEDAGSELISAY